MNCFVTGAAGEAVAGENGQDWGGKIIFWLGN